MNDENGKEAEDQLVNEVLPLNTDTSVEQKLPGNSDPLAVKKNERKFDFNLNTVLILILFAGLVVLYVLFFTSVKSGEPVIPLALQKSGSKALSVVFVNIDSLNVKYEFVKTMHNELESTGKRYQTEIFAEQSAFEKEASDFQKQVAGNSIPEDRAKVVYEQLMKKQQALMDKKDRYTQEISEQEPLV